MEASSRQSLHKDESSSCSTNHPLPIKGQTVRRIFTELGSGEPQIDTLIADGVISIEKHKV